MAQRLGLLQLQTTGQEQISGGGREGRPGQEQISGGGRGDQVRNQYQAGGGGGGGGGEGRGGHDRPETNIKRARLLCEERGVGREERRGREKGEGYEEKTLTYESQSGRTNCHALT